MSRTALGRARIACGYETASGPPDFQGRGGTWPFWRPRCQFRGRGLLVRSEHDRAVGGVQNCKPESTESLVERNGVGGDTAVRKVGGWAEATYAWAMTRSRRRCCGNRDERDALDSNSACTRHKIDAQRRCALQRHARSTLRWADGRRRCVRVRVEDLEETWGQDTRSLSF